MSTDDTGWFADQWLGWYRTGTWSAAGHVTG